MAMHLMMRKFKCIELSCPECGSAPYPELRIPCTTESKSCDPQKTSWWLNCSSNDWRTPIHQDSNHLQMFCKVTRGKRRTSAPQLSWACWHQKPVPQLSRAMLTAETFPASQVVYGELPLFLRDARKALMRFASSWLTCRRVAMSSSSLSSEESEESLLSMHSPGSRSQRIFSRFNCTRAFSELNLEELQTPASDGMEPRVASDLLEGSLAVRSMPGVEARVVVESGVIPALGSHHLFRSAALSGVDAYMDCRVYVPSASAPCKPPRAGLLQPFEELADELPWTDLSDEITSSEKLFSPAGSSEWVRRGHEFRSSSASMSRTSTKVFLTTVTNRPGLPPPPSFPCS
mmetsp:Transcript_26842/g.52520  ORF Transcript_26842/g.52520 Transcript_26842/m.52520 type:complete len:346 (+) Transcript_26842:125-1162(+)